MSLLSFFKKNKVQKKCVQFNVLPDRTSKISFETGNNVLVNKAKQCKNNKKKYVPVRGENSLRIQRYNSSTFSSLNPNLLAKNPVYDQEIVILCNGKLRKIPLEWTTMTSYFFYEWREPFYLIFHHSYLDLDSAWMIDFTLGKNPWFNGFVLKQGDNYQKCALQGTNL